MAAGAGQPSQHPGGGRGPGPGAWGRTGTGPGQGASPRTGVGGPGPLATGPGHRRCLRRLHPLPAGHGGRLVPGPGPGRPRQAPGRAPALATAAGAPTGQPPGRASLWPAGAGGDRSPKRRRSRHPGGRQGPALAPALVWAQQHGADPGGPAPGPLRPAGRGDLPAHPLPGPLATPRPRRPGSWSGPPGPSRPGPSRPGSRRPGSGGPRSERLGRSLHCRRRGSPADGVWGGRVVEPGSPWRRLAPGRAQPGGPFWPARRRIPAIAGGQRRDPAGRIPAAGPVCRRRHHRRGGHRQPGAAASQPAGAAPAGPGGSGPGAAPGAPPGR